MSTNAGTMRDYAGERGGDADISSATRACARRRRVRAPLPALASLLTSVLAFAPLLALALGALSACSRSYRGPYPRVILISLDTTRADHIGCYGSPLVKTPNIDRLARESVVFRHVTSAAPTTLASHTSIMTGLYPHTHGVVRNGFTLPLEDETLAQILKRNGFRTAAFLGSFALDRRFGFDRGFDVFDETFDIALDARNFDQDQRRAAAVTDAALSWVEKTSREPAFLFVHYFDAHAPYAAPPPFDRMYARPDGPAAAGTAEIERAVRDHQHEAIGLELGQQAVIGAGLTRELALRGGGAMTERDRDLEAAYAGEISYVDRELGRLFDGLERRGWLEGSIVIVVADHGESFVEHGDYWNHGLCVYDTTVHVPLLVRRSDHLGARAVDAPVSTVDVAPTLLALLHIDAPRAIEGVDLAPALDGAPLERGPVFSEATQPPRVEVAGAWGNAQKAKCVRAGKWKLIRTPYLELEELYDLEADPGERHNLLAAPPGDALASARSVAADLRAKLDAWSRGAHPRASAFDRSQTDETLRRLKGLGYAEGDDARTKPPR